MLASTLLGRYARAAIEEFCDGNGIEVVGRVPFDPEVTKAIVAGKPIVDYAPDSPSSRAIGETWKRVKSHLGV